VEHASTLAAIHRIVDVLPMRAGAAAADDGAVRGLLRRHCGEWAFSLDRLEGACEVGLRIALAGRPSPSSASWPPAASPREYLALRRGRYAWADELARQAETAISEYVEGLDDLCRDWRRLIPAPAGLVRLTLLIDRRRLDALRARLDAIRKGRPAERCTASGPWPPYCFV
jgi:Gas vesicle synthesis protein GvpL/GvpF